MNNSNFGWQVTGEKITSPIKPQQEDGTGATSQKSIVVMKQFPALITHSMPAFQQNDSDGFRIRQSLNREMIRQNQSSIKQLPSSRQTSVQNSQRKSQKPASPQKGKKLSKQVKAIDGASLISIVSVKPKKAKLHGYGGKVFKDFAGHKHQDPNATATISQASKYVDVDLNGMIQSGGADDSLADEPVDLPPLNEENHAQLVTVTQQEYEQNQTTYSDDNSQNRSRNNHTMDSIDTRKGHDGPPGLLNININNTQSKYLQSQTATLNRDESSRAPFSTTSQKHRGSVYLEDAVFQTTPHQHPKRSFVQPSNQLNEFVTKVMSNRDLHHLATEHDVLRQLNVDQALRENTQLFKQLLGEDDKSEIRVEDTNQISESADTEDQNNGEILYEGTPAIQDISANTAQVIEMSRAADNTKLNLDQYESKKFRSVQRPLQNEQARKVLQMKQILNQEAAAQGIIPTSSQPVSQQQMDKLLKNIQAQKEKREQLSLGLGVFEFAKLPFDKKRKRKSRSIIEKQKQAKLRQKLEASEDQPAVEEGDNLQPTSIILTLRQPSQKEINENDYQVVEKNDMVTDHLQSVSEMKESHNTGGKGRFKIHKQQSAETSPTSKKTPREQLQEHRRTLNKHQKAKSMAAARSNQVYFWKKYLVNDYIVRGDNTSNHQPKTTDSFQQQQQPLRKRKVSQETDSSQGNTSSFSTSIPKIMTSRDAPQNGNDYTESKVSGRRQSNNSSANKAWQQPFAKNGLKFMKKLDRKQLRIDTNKSQTSRGVEQSPDIRVLSPIKHSVQVGEYDMAQGTSGHKLGKIPSIAAHDDTSESTLRQHELVDISIPERPTKEQSHQYDKLYQSEQQETHQIKKKKKSMKTSQKELIEVTQMNQSRQQKNLPIKKNMHFPEIPQIKSNSLQKLSNRATTSLRVLQKSMPVTFQQKSETDEKSASQLKSEHMQAQMTIKKMVASIESNKKIKESDLAHLSSRLKLQPKPTQVTNSTTNSQSLMNLATKQKLRRSRMQFEEHDNRQALINELESQGISVQIVDRYFEKGSKARRKSSAMEIVSQKSKQLQTSLDFTNKSAESSIEDDLNEEMRKQQVTLRNEDRASDGNLPEDANLAVQGKIALPKTRIISKGNSSNMSVRNSHKKITHDTKGVTSDQLQLMQVMINEEFRNSFPISTLTYRPADADMIQSPKRTTIDEARESQETFDVDFNILEPMNLNNGQKINLSIQAKELSHHQQINLEILRQQTQVVNNDSVDTESVRDSSLQELRQMAAGNSPLSNASSSYINDFHSKVVNLKNKSGEWNSLKDTQYPMHLQNDYIDSMNKTKTALTVPNNSLISYTKVKRQDPQESHFKVDSCAPRAQSQMKIGNSTVGGHSSQLNFKLLELQVDKNMDHLHKTTKIKDIRRRSSSTLSSRLRINGQVIGQQKTFKVQSSMMKDQSNDIQSASNSYFPAAAATEVRENKILGSVLPQVKKPFVFVSNGVPGFQQELPSRSSPSVPIHLPQSMSSQQSNENQTSRLLSSSRNNIQFGRASQL